VPNSACPPRSARATNAAKAEWRGRHEDEDEDGEDGGDEDDMEEDGEWVGDVRHDGDGGGDGGERPPNHPVQTKVRIIPTRKRRHLPTS
jgi:hypothetical protein